MAIEEVISVSAGSAVEQVDAVASAFESLAAKAAGAVDKINASLSSVGEGSGAASAGADKLAVSMEAAAARIAEAADKAGASLGKIGESAAGAAGGVERLGGAADAAAGGLGDVSASADEAAAASSRLADAADAAAGGLDRQAVAGERAGAGAASAAEGTGGFAKGAKAALLGLAVAGAYGIDKAMKFQSQMLLLNTQAGVSMPAVRKLSQGVLEISTQTGQSLSDVAASAYHVASNMESLGGTVPQQLNAVKIAAEGASVGHSNLVDTTNALTSVIASGIPGAKNYGQAMGAINATVGAGDMSMQDLSEAMATGVVPVVKGYGLTLKDTGAALATYGDLNIRGAKAGTELRMAVQALAVPAAAGKTELASLGLTTKSLSDDMQSGGLGKALDDLNTRFKANGINAKNMGGVITDIFGKKAGAGLSLLMENLDRFQSKYPALTKGANDFNAAWNKTQATPQQKFKEMTAGFEALAVNFGTTLLPAFTQVSGFIDGILAKLNSSKGAVAGLAIGLGALGGLFAANKLVSGVESAFKTGETVLSGVGKVAQVLQIPGLNKLAGIGSNAGAAGAAGMQKAGTTAAEGAGAMQRAADTMVEAAGAMQRAADTMVGTGAERPPGVPAGEPVPAGGAAGTVPTRGAGTAEEAATAAEDAGAGLLGGSVLGKIKIAGARVLGRVMIGAAIAYAGNQAANMLPSSDQQAKAPIRVLSDMAGGAYAGSAFGPPGTAIGAGIGLWAGLGANTNLTTFPDEYSRGTQNAGGGNNVAFGKTGPLTATPWDVGFERTSPPPPPAPTTLPAYRSTAGFRGTTSAAESAPIKAKVEVDLASVGAAKTKAMTELQGISDGLKPAKLPEPDTSAVNAAKTKAQNALQQIASAKIQPVKIPEPDTSGVTTAKTKVISTLASIRGPATAAGAGAGAGLAAGILSEQGAVEAAARTLAAEATAALQSALQTHSPSKVTEAIGADTGAGVAVGITKSKAKVKAAAITITESAVSTLVTGLQGGQTAIDAAMTALGQSTAKPQDIQAIEAATAKLKTDLSSALSKKIIGKPEDSALTQMLTADTAKLEGLAAKRDELVAEITNSQQIATSVIGNASILNAATAVPTQSITAQSSQETVQGMQWQAQQAQQFAQQLKQLKSEGLNATSLDQLAQGGATASMPVTEGLISGGKGAVSQLNQLQSQITSAAGQIGDVGGVASYQSGQQIAAQTGKGLKSQLASVDAEMKQLASGMVNAVKSAVGGAGLEAAMKAAGASAGQGFAAGIKSETSLVSAAASSLAAAAEAAAKAHLQAKSPSQLFAMIGASVPEGFVKGVTGGIPSVESAVMRMAQLAAAGAAGHPQPSFAPGWAVSHGGGSGGSGGGTPVTINVTLTLDGQQLATATQTVNLQRASNNWQSGLNYPYKAA